MADLSSNDRISNLPDVLIHQILSYLPTKEAMATSILSKRWRSRWTLVPVLNLADRSCGASVPDKMQFKQNVERVLQFNKAVSLEKFHLKCSSCYDSFIATWVCTAMDRGLQELNITIALYNSKWIKLSGGFFIGMKALKVLKLINGAILDVPASVCFPRLKILHLLWVDFESDKSISNLFSGCIALEELHIRVDWRSKTVVNFNIPIPTLKSLLIDYRIRALSSADLIHEAHDAYPLFVNLTQLELTGCFEDWNALSLLLQNCHYNLKTLILTKVTFDHSPQWTLIKPLDVPEFLHLRNVYCRKFEGLEPEIMMVACMLRSARSLKIMEIYTVKMSLAAKLGILKKLSMLTRCSDTFQLSFN